MEYRLKEILQDKGYIRGPFGSSLKRNELKSTGIPVYEQQHAIYATREFRYYIDEEKYSQMKRFTVKPKDLIISCSGTIGKVDLISEKDPIGIISQALLILRANTDIVLPEYLFYFLKSDYGYNSIISRSMGSVQVNIAKREVIENIKINIPSLKEQEKIVKILSNIDEKIKLNNQINDNLLKIGLELVKEDFNKKAEYEVLSNAIKFVKGKKPLDITPEIKEKYKKYLTIACLNGQELNYADPTKMVLSNNDLLMVMDGASSGDVYYAGQGIVASTLSKVDCIDGNYISEFIYFIMKYYKDLIQSKNTGSAIPHTDKVFVGNLKVPKLLIEEQEKYKTLLYKILKNMNENKILEQLRDTLLPKLMNGEVDLDKIEI